MSRGVCQGCGCSDARACEGGCFWVLPDVCSRCAIQTLAAAGVASPLVQLHEDLVDAAMGGVMSMGEHRGPDDHLPQLWRPGDPI